MSMLTAGLKAKSTTDPSGHHIIHAEDACFVAPRGVDAAEFLTDQWALDDVENANKSSPRRPRVRMCS